MWKNFENRQVIGEDMDKSQVSRFFVHHSYIHLNMTLNITK